MSRLPCRPMRSRNAVSRPAIEPAWRHAGRGSSSASPSCRREAIPSLRKAWRRWNSTVEMVTKSASAISRLVRPAAASPATRRLAGRERPRAAGQRAARPRAGGAQLGERLVLQVGGSAAVGEVDGDPQRYARLDRPAGAPQGGARGGVGPRALEVLIRFGGVHGGLVRTRHCTAVGAPLYYADARAPDQDPPVRPARRRDRRPRRDRRHRLGPGRVAPVLPARQPRPAGRPRRADRRRVAGAAAARPAGSPAADPLAAPARARAGDHRGARPAPARAARAGVAGRRAGRGGAPGRPAARAARARAGGARPARAGLPPPPRRGVGAGTPPAGGGAGAGGARVGRARRPRRRRSRRGRAGGARAGRALALPRERPPAADGGAGRGRQRRRGAARLRGPARPPARRARRDARGRDRRAPRAAARRRGRARPRPAAGHPRAARGAFIGRAAELEALAQAWARRARAGALRDALRPARDRQDAPDRRARAGRARRGHRALRELPAGAAALLPAVRRGARPLRPQRRHHGRAASSRS